MLVVVRQRNTDRLFRRPCSPTPPPVSSKVWTDAENKSPAYPTIRRGTQLTGNLPVTCQQPFSATALGRNRPAHSRATDRTVQTNDQHRPAPAILLYGTPRRTLSSKPNRSTSGPLIWQATRLRSLTDDAAGLTASVAGTQYRCPHTYDDAGRKETESLQIGGQHLLASNGLRTHRRPSVQ